MSQLKQGYKQTNPSTSSGRVSVRPGYKETRVGIIPDDWEVVRLKSLGEIESGGTPSTTDEKYWDGDIQWATPTDITSLDSKYISQTKRTISELGLKESSAKLLPANSLLVCTRATIGYSAICTVPISTNQGFKNLIPNEKIDLHFLYFQLNIRRSRLMALSSGSTFLELSKRDFEKVQIPLPPLPEQKKIAEILSTWDEAIEKQQKLIKSKKKLKKGLMQQLLTGKKRFPEFVTLSSSKGKDTNPESSSGRVAKYGFKETRIGKVPEDWEVVRIDEFAPLQRGFDLPKRDLQEGKYAVGYSNGIMNYHSEYKTKGPGVWTGRSGTIGKVFYTEENYWPHNTTLWVTDFKANYPLFVFYFYKNLKLERFNAGTSVPTLNRNDVHSFKIPLPPLPEQKKIAEVLSKADTEIEILERELVTMQKEKKGLMQKLLTGEIRVNPVK